MPCLPIGEMSHNKHYVLLMSITLRHASPGILCCFYLSGKMHILQVLYQHCPPWLNHGYMLKILPRNRSDWFLNFRLLFKFSGEDILYSTNRLGREGTLVNICITIADHLTRAEWYNKWQMLSFNLCCVLHIKCTHNHRCNTNIYQWYIKCHFSVAQS